MFEKNRHIVFLARWYPHRYDPMFGLFVQRHAEAVALFNKVTVVYVHADSHSKEKMEVVRSNENGVDAIRVYYRKAGLITSAFRFYRSCRKALKLAGKPDLIHVHVLTRMGVMAWLEKIRHKTPYLITEHWSRYLPGNDFSGLLRKVAARIVVKNASMVTTVTENLAQAMQRHGLKNQKYVVLPNVVDTALFKPCHHQNEIPHIVHVSCFEDKSKNVSGLLQAIHLLKAQGFHFHAVLIGDGIDFLAMQQLSASMQLDDCVSFTGLLEGRALVDVLVSGDFLVLSSNYENLPVVILEALSCGLPVVSTRVGGIAEIVNESNGILVKPHDVDAMAKALKQMCLSYGDYNTAALRQSIVERYDKKAVGHLLSTWYDDIAKP